MCVLILSPNFMGQTMSADERAQFMQWHEEQKGKLFSNKDELLAYCMDDVNVLRQACCAFRNLFLKLVIMDPFREAITISSICKKVFRTMFLKPDAVGIIPRAGCRMGERQSIEGLQWLSYIGRTRKIINAGNGREVHLAGVHNVKVDGYCRETNEVFEYLGCFGMGVFACPIDINPLATLRKHWRTGMRKQWRSCKKSKTLFTLLFRSGGLSLENYCVTLLALKMNFARTPM